MYKIVMTQTKGINEEKRSGYFYRWGTIDERDRKFENKTITDAKPAKILYGL